MITQFTGLFEDGILIPLESLQEYSTVMAAKFLAQRTSQSFL